MEFYDYFQTNVNYFWSWEEGTELLSIDGGHTIAYRKHISAILDYLSEYGIPPFGSLLLVIIATNNTFGNSLMLVEKIVQGFLIKEEGIDQAYSDGLILEDSMIFLRLLAKLPQEYKQGDKRLLLIQALFDNCHNMVSSKKAKLISQRLTKDDFNKEKLSFKTEFFILNRFRRDFGVLVLLNKQFQTIESILEAISNIPDVNSTKLNLENQTELESKDFIEELIKNKETFHIGSLITHLWSGLNIPYHNSAPTQHPLGGLADLTNKGDFDKLLITEFANDDLVLLSRLANNEALYFRREIPPSINNFRRFILIDISLNNWGTPKTLAYAVMLAIAKHPKTNFDCEVYVIGDEYNSVSFTDINELIQSFRILDGCLGCSKGLYKFFQEIPLPPNVEFFFISSFDSMALLSMKKAISDLHFKIDYIVNIDSGGYLELFKRNHKNKKFIQSLQLPLNTLWKESSNKAEKEGLYTQEIYPILFPPARSVKKILITDTKEIFIISNDKKLFRIYDTSFDSPTKGWELIIENLPSSINSFEIGKMSNGDFVFFCFQPSIKKILIYNLATGAYQDCNFNDWSSSSSYKNFFFFDNAFHFLKEGFHWVIEYDQMISIIKNNRIDNYLISIYKTRDNQLQTLNKSFKPAHNILKKIKSVFINKNNNLVFNTHELTLSKNDRLEFQGSLCSESEIIARLSAKDKFDFPDGSYIEINRSGLFILKSSNESIPVIYVVAVLGFSLAMSTYQHFAGNDYYYPVNYNNLEKISNTEFVKKYIENFINNIKDYAPKHKT